MKSADPVLDLGNGRYPGFFSDVVQLLWGPGSVGRGGAVRPGSNVDTEIWCRCADGSCSEKESVHGLFPIFDMPGGDDDCFDSA